MATVADVAHGGFQVRLFQEALDLVDPAAQVGAVLDIAEAGFRMSRTDAEGDDAVLRRLGGSKNGVAEGVRLGDDVIGRHHQHQGVGIAVAASQGGDRGDRGGVARHRLEDDRLGPQGDLTELSVGHLEMTAAANDDGRGERFARQAHGGFLDHRLFGGQGMKLLRRGRRRQRPQARAGATGHDGGNDLGAHGNPGLKAKVSDFKWAGIPSVIDRPHTALYKPPM